MSIASRILTRTVLALVGLFGLAIALVPAAGPASASGADFVSEWKTDNGGASGADQILLPLYNGGSYDFAVNWGDGSDDHIGAWDDPDRIHTYPAPGIYTVTITGTITGWSFNNGGDRQKILAISAWGPLNFGNQGGAFYGAGNLDVTATDIPNLTGVTTLASAFRDCTSLTAIGGDWNTRGVTLLTNMFAGAAAFNQDLGNWDVRDVEDAAKMFDGVTLPTPTYSDLLIGWANQGVLPNVRFGGGNSTYDAAGGEARNVLIGPLVDWMITDGGPAAGPGFNPSPASKSFGNQAVNTRSSWQTFTITNSGYATLTISSITLTGANAGQFALGSNTCTGAPVASLAACTVQAAFRPTRTGATSAGLTFTHDATGYPTTIPLTGTGVVPSPTNLRVSSGTYSLMAHWRPTAGATSQVATLRLTRRGGNVLNRRTVLNGTAATTTWLINVNPGPVTGYRVCVTTRSPLGESSPTCTTNNRHKRLHSDRKKSRVRNHQG